MSQWAPLSLGIKDEVNLLVSFISALETVVSKSQDVAFMSDLLRAWFATMMEIVAHDKS